MLNFSESRKYCTKNYYLFKKAKTYISAIGLLLININAMMHRGLIAFFCFAIETNKLLNFKEMAAQAWIFFIAGFETSSTTLSFCLFELAKNQEIQQRVHKEIDDVLQRHANQLTYESVGEMKYLECCIDGKAFPACCFIKVTKQNLFCCFQKHYENIPHSPY